MQNPRSPIVASDVLIVGAGPAGLCCAIELQARGLKTVLIEKGSIVNSLENFPTQMRFFTSPRLVMTSAEQCSDLDQETARMRASGRVLRLQGEDHGKARREAGAQIDGIGAQCSWHRYWRSGVYLMIRVRSRVVDVLVVGIELNLPA
jgi:glycine/D-amino acid oxidase-like deaminating enzyme